MNFKTTIIVTVVAFMMTPSFAQDSKDDIKDWYLKDLSGEIRGTNIEKAYNELLAEKSPQEKIVVAVIDSGIDTDHEDLADIIWVNEDEIADNGIDDDNNGYVDDIKGWNFIGNANGDMVGKDNLEVAREYKRLSEKWEGKNPTEIKEGDTEEWKYFQRVKNDFEEGKNKAAQMKKQFESFSNLYYNAKTALAAELGKDFTQEDVKEFVVTDSMENAQVLNQAKMIMLDLYKNGVDDEYVEGYADYVSSQADWYYNQEIDVRRDVIKDDPNNLYEKGYGNNNVDGVEPDHGTHVAGIIGAVRGNGIGIDGVANNILIMPVRTVPGGDEHDKDVANAIRYAVDNGARVVNMSFGKSYSPNEKIVAEAIQYADEHDVLLIHAAGNDGTDIDTGFNYPTNYSDHIKGKVKNFITVGASSLNASEEFVASFSNYGGDKVDIFAPGVDIYSTYPENEYHFNNGTSMAAPVVSGVAALILSYYPDLNANKLRKILLKTASDFSDEIVYVPGTGGKDDTGKDLPKEEVEFEELSTTAGLINAYEALKMADKKSKY